MAAEDIRIRWDATPTDFTVTNLPSLAADTIWQPGEINDASPSHNIVRISYELVFNATPVAGDKLVFYLSQGDEASSNEIWTGNIGTSEGEITTAAAIAAVKAACPVVNEHAWQTGHGTTFKKMFDIYNFGPSYQVLIEAVGEALSAGTQRLRRRYGTYQRQTS